MNLKKMIKIMGNPESWKTLYTIIANFFINTIKYRNFSINPNTKTRWNQMFLDTDIFTRNEHYLYLLDLFPRNKKFSLLDIGCAIGSGCELLQKQFPKARISGVDISDVGIMYATKRNNDISYFVLDILKNPIPNTYDWITIIQSLEHFDDPFIVVDKCLKYVRQSLIISVPYKQTLSTTNKLTNRSWHRYVFDEKTFQNYNHRIITISEYLESTKARCIIYEIFPKQE